MRAILTIFGPVYGDVDQLLINPIQYGINTFDTHNAVVMAVLNYALQHRAPALIKYMGGPAMIEQKILARVNVVTPQ